MTGFAFHKNTVFEWSGVVFRIERLQPNGEVLLERVQDACISIVTREQLLDDYRNGNITTKIQSAGNVKMQASIFSRPLDELSDDVQQEVKRRRHYLDVILEDGKPIFTKDYLSPLILKAADQIEDKNPPSATSIYRWYRRYKIDHDGRSLIPRFDLRGSRKLRQHAKSLQLASDAIEEAFKASPQATGPGVYTRLIAKIDLENRSLTSSEKLKAPSLRTLYRMLSRVDAYDRTVLKEGKLTADKKFRLVKAGTKTTRILERVEIDHTPLDLFLIDEKSWLPLGRPVLTVILDHFSRMLLGFHLSFGAPSSGAVMAALRHAILPKKSIQNALPNLKIEHPWLCYGRPDVIVVDNGLEFHGNTLESVAYDLGIRIQYCPKHEPRFKGAVERYLKTINYFFAHQLPGTSFARWHLRGDYDPAKQAVLTLGEFQQIFQKWVMDVYSQTIHRGISTTPWARWQEGLKFREPELPESVKALQQRIGQVDERALRHDGILLHGIRYNGSAVAPILNTYGAGTKCRVLYDHEDLGDIQVWGPDAEEPVTILALDQTYARGLTSLQNQMIRTAARDSSTLQHNPISLEHAKLAIIDTVQELMGSRKQRDRRRAAAIRGLSNTDPSREFSPAPSTSQMNSANIKAHKPEKRNTSKVIDQDKKPSVAYSFFRQQTPADRGKIQ